MTGGDAVISKEKTTYLLWLNDTEKPQLPRKRGETEEQIRIFS